MDTKSTERGLFAEPPPEVAANLSYQQLLNLKAWARQCFDAGRAARDAEVAAIVSMKKSAGDILRLLELDDAARAQTARPEAYTQLESEEEG
jgi:hypothetical protein